MKLLREYIRELLKEDGILGKWVWPTAVKGDQPNEPDTEIEKKLYYQLNKHFGSSSYMIKKDQPPLDAEAIGAIKQILASGEYPNTFERCSSGEVMRGMRVTLPWLKRNAPEALAALPDKDLPEWNSSFTWNEPVPVSFAYSSKGKYGQVSSWTNDWKIARSFTTNANKPKTLECILYSDCSTGLFMHTQAFSRYRGGDYEVSKLNPQGRGEREIMLLGDCQITAIQLYGTKETWAKYKGVVVDPSLEWMV